MLCLVKISKELNFYYLNYKTAIHLSSAKIIENVDKLLTSRVLITFLKFQIYFKMSLNF